MKNKYPFSGVLVRFEKDNKQKAMQGPLPSLENPQTVPAENSNQQDSYGHELHVNIWDFETSDAIIDIGLMVKDEENEEISAICIDVPWEIQKDHIFDIASRIDGEKILEAIFNRDAGYESNSLNPASRNPKVSFHDEAPKDFLLIRLNFNQIEVENILIPGFKPVTRIRLKPDFDLILRELRTNRIQRYYFRIRLLHVPQETFRILFSQKDRNLLSSCIEETVLDFRLNTRRGIPQEILYPTKKEFDYPEFNQIHLFLISHRDKQPTFQSTNFKTCRSLEDENVWNDYIRLDEGHGRHAEMVNDYLGYQWSSSRVSKEMAVLGRFSRVSSNNWTMFRFVVIALILGAASNGLWEVWEQLTKVVMVPKDGNLTFKQYFESIGILLLVTILMAYLLNLIFLVLSKCWKHFKRIICLYSCERRA